MDTGTTPTTGGGSTTYVFDTVPITDRLDKQYNTEHDYFLFSIALNGLVVALLLVSIFVKGFQSNAR